MHIQNEETVPYQEQSMLQKAITVIKYPIAAAAGWFVGHRHARNALYDNLRRRGMFDDELNTLQEGYNDLKPPKSPQGDILPHEPISWKGKIFPLDKQFDVNVTKVLREKGFRNTIDYFKEIGRHQKWDTVFAAAGATSIALGVMMTIAQSKTVTERFKKAHAPDSEVSR